MQAQSTLVDERDQLARQVDALLASVLVFEAATLANQVSTRRAVTALEVLNAVIAAR